jgi:hypothetical protein
VIGLGEVFFQTTDSGLAEGVALTSFPFLSEEETIQYENRSVCLKASAADSNRNSSRVR